MPEKYFQKFPLINYDGFVARDITRRTVIKDSLQSNPYLFQPYEVQHNERPDQLADRYYQDQYQSWLVFMANDVIDPYHDWVLSEEDFQSFLMKKYGNTDTIQQKVMFYRNNWFNHSDMISVSRFDALDVSEIKYWNSVLGASNKIVGYVRKQIDWNLSTNRIAQYTLANSATFEPDEIVDIVISTGKTGQGQVIYSSQTILCLQHLSGFHLPTQSVPLSNASVTGRESGVTASVTAATLVQDNIGTTEGTYWDAVTIYDYEEENNTSKKLVRLVDNRYAMQISQELTSLLKK